jgi:hypothetical protein
MELAPTVSSGVDRYQRVDEAPARVPAHNITHSSNRRVYIDWRSERVALLMHLKLDEATAAEFARFLAPKIKQNHLPPMQGRLDLSKQSVKALTQDDIILQH